MFIYLEKSDKAKTILHLVSFSMSLCSIGSTLLDDELEKSDKAKTEVHNHDSSLMQSVFDRLDTGLWQYDLVRERKERSF